MAEPRWAVFDRDARGHSGYLYTTDRISSQLANQRNIDVVIESVSLQGKSVLDLGCGDGFLTIRLWDRGKPRAMTAVEPAAAAVEVANRNKQDRPIRFEVADSRHLRYRDDQFDLVLLLGVLHHDDEPARTIREALRVAPELLILEPNGNNPALKVLEKVSKYHRDHGEKSYLPSTLRGWIREAGGGVISDCFAGLVPVLSPDAVARLLKRVEPLLERTPLLNALGCSVYVVVARRGEPALRG
jgi:SAM-dependent methyltransferase